MTALTEHEDGEILVCAIHLPQALERRRKFLAANQIEGVRFAFVDGVDGRQLDARELARQRLMTPGTRGFTSSTLGSGLAHRAIWLQAAASGAPALAGEDDAVFRKDFRRQFDWCIGALPDDWDFILLGYNFDAVLEAEIIPGVESLRGHFLQRPLGESELRRFQETTAPVSVIPLKNAFGLPGYAISPAGARHLLSRVFPLHNRPVPIPALSRTIASFSVDCLMNALYSGMRAYASAQKLIPICSREDSVVPQGQDRVFEDVHLGHLAVGDFNFGGVVLHVQGALDL